MTLKATYTPDGLLAGSQQCQTKAVVVLTGAALVRGTVLGKITAGTTPSTGTAGGGNTGGGSCASVTAGRRVKVGTYALTCIAGGVTANKGAFKVLSPSGLQLGTAYVGEAFTSPEINFTLADSGTDFIEGDTFTIVVPAGSGKYKKVDKSHLDGSGVADCVLSEDTASLSADVTAIAYKTGQFAYNKLVYGGSDTKADHEADLRLNDINIVTEIQTA